MKNLVAAMFKKSPRDRPAVNTILRMPFLATRVEKWLPPELFNKEFAHTILHKENIMAAKPIAASPASPAPKPAEPPSRPQSAAKAPSRASSAGSS